MIAWDKVSCLDSAGFVYCIAASYCHVYQAVRQMHLTFSQDNLSLLKRHRIRISIFFFSQTLMPVTWCDIALILLFVLQVRRAAGPRNAVGQQQLDDMSCQSNVGWPFTVGREAERKRKGSLHYFQLLVLKPDFLLNWAIGYFMNLLLTSALNPASWWDQFRVFAAQWKSYLKTCFCLYSCWLSTGMAV